MQAPVAALILAAGSATRMGRLKQLLPLGDKPVLRHSIDALDEAGVGEMIVVCGADAEKYRPALENSRARLVQNRNAASEMADSVRLGLRRIEAAAYPGVLICLADHPLVRPETCRALINQLHQSPGTIVIPAYEGKRGHPALFPAAIIKEIFAKPSLRDIVRSDPSRVLVLDVPDEGVVLDMDTEEDYQRAIRLYQIRSGKNAQECEGSSGFTDDHRLHVP